MGSRLPQYRNAAAGLRNEADAQIREEKNVEHTINDDVLEETLDNRASQMVIDRHLSRFSDGLFTWIQGRHSTSERLERDEVAPSPASH